MTSASQGNAPGPPRNYETGPRRQAPPPPEPGSRAGASGPPAAGQHDQLAQHPQTQDPGTQDPATRDPATQDPWAEAPATEAAEARGLEVPEGQPSAAFGAEVRQAVCYENGLAVKALIALAIVAVLIASRLLGA